MSEYIKREDALNFEVEVESNPNDVQLIMQGMALYAEHIKKIPAANVVELLNGRAFLERVGVWQITECFPHNVYCSECHKLCAQTHWAVWKDGSLPRNFCPNCGARMVTDDV